MKRTILFALMIPLLLTGCGARRDAENWKAFAETVETAERISFHAEITAHWEDSSASFGADVARAGGETHITLTAPETVSGIAVRAKDGETAAEFDGVILSLDAGRSETLSPCGAPQRAVDTLKALAIELGFGGTVVTTPEHHDTMIAYTSQLPHVLACAYVMSPCCPQHNGFSAGSYRDVSRVARINEVLWTELFLDNADALTGELDILIDNITRISEAVKQRDADALRGLLRQGRLIKERLGE